MLRERTSRPRSERLQVKCTSTDKNSPAKFEGECRHCGKKGHKWAVCQKCLAEAKDKKVHDVDGETPSTATVAAVEDTEEIDEAGICGGWSDDEDNRVDTDEAWVLSMEGDNKPVDAEFLPLDSACEEHTCPRNFAESGRDLSLECAVEKREWSLNFFMQESDGVKRRLGFRKTRDIACSSSFHAERRQKASSQCWNAHAERRRSQVRKQRLLD